MPGPELQTKHFTKYHTLTSYGKEYLYSFSFNPHLINFHNVYKGILKGSYMQSIARRFHCTNDPLQSDMENGGCVEYETGRYLTSLGFKQVWVKIRKDPIYEHIGVENWSGPKVKIFQWIGTNTITESSSSSTPIVKK